MNTFVRGLIASLALGLLGWTATPALAQSTSATQANQKPAWTQHFEKQMVELLRAPDTERQEQAMQLIIQFAQQNDADGQPVFDFSRTAPTLLERYKQSPDQGHRLLALAALSAVNNEPAMRELASTLRFERSEVVRQRTLHMLSAHLTQ